MHGPERDEDISDVIAGRFCSLASLAGADAALSMVKNSEAYIINIEPARVAEYFEAWEARVGDRAETIELLRLNPNLMAGQIDDIKTAQIFDQADQGRREGDRLHAEPVRLVSSDSSWSRLEVKATRLAPAPALCYYVVCTRARHSELQAKRAPRLRWPHVD